MKNCPSPETLLLAQRLAIVADIPETGAWIVVDGPCVASLYLDLIEAHRGGEVRKAVRFFVAYNAAAAAKADLEGDLPVYRDPAFVERYPAKPAPAPSVLLVGKPEHVALIVELMGYGFALRDLLRLDIEVLELLALQAELVDMLTAAIAA